MISAVQLQRKIGQVNVRSRWLLSSPALIIVIAVAISPLFIVLLYSFLAPGPYGGVLPQFSAEGWTGVILKKDIFDGSLHLASANILILWRSVKLSIATTLLTILFGFPTAYFIATRPRRTRNTWLFLITVPFWTNFLIRTFAIEEIIRNEGVINTLLLKLGLIQQPLQLMFTDFSLLLGMTYVFLPLMILPLYASIEKVDFRLAEAAFDLYATRIKVLLHVIVPLVKPGLVAGSILVFIPSLGAYVTPRVLGGNTHLMVGNFIALQFGDGRNWPLGSALSMSLMAVVTLSLLFYVRNASR